MVGDWGLSLESQEDMWAGCVVDVMEIGSWLTGQGLERPLSPHLTRHGDAYL
jgi:hypothetical protein